MHKKSLYEPAPENPSPVKAKSLAQGSISSSPKNTTVPKVKWNFVIYWNFFQNKILILFRFYALHRLIFFICPFR